MNLNPIIKLPIAELKNNLVGFGKVIPRSSTLPILSTIHIERDRAGWVHLTATDLDTFVTLRLEAPGQHGDPAKCLVPYVELQKLAKTCPADETLELEVFSTEKLILRHRIGTHPVEQIITTDPVAEFPAAPEFHAAAASLDEATRANMLNALECASDDETRYILNGAYLDVSKPESHYIVATDGRHLFATNSLRLPVAKSVIIPDHRFVTWGGFVRDGLWKLAVKDTGKDEKPCLKLESRHWTFVAKQIEGNYPNWRQIIPDQHGYVGNVELSDSAAEEIQRIVPRLPGANLQHRTLGLCVYGSKLFLRGWNEGDERATEVEVPGVNVSGKPDNVYVNRDYLLKAVGFGLRQISLQEPLKPVRLHDGGSRQMIIMPVRVDAHPGSKPTVPASTPENTVTQAAPSNTQTHRTEPISCNPQPEGNTTMQNPVSNHDGNGNPPAVETATSPIGEKSPLEQALEQIESIKGSMRGAVTSLNGLADSLRQIHRERRLSEREIRSVRDTLKTLQTVRL